MKLVLAWSGDTSKEIAGQLHAWFPLVLPGVVPWMSSKDIRKGVRWREELARELAAAGFGILCLTPDNVTAPWVLFEAGSIGRRERSHVAPVLFGLEPGAVPDPLAQFQCTVFERTDIARLVGTMALELTPPPIWQASLAAHWPSLARKVEVIPRVMDGSEREDEEAEEVDGPVADALDVEEEEILLLLAEIPEDEGRDWIDLDDVRDHLRVGTRVAEYYLGRLEARGLIEEDEDEEGYTIWFLSAEGIQLVVEEGWAD